MYNEKMKKIESIFFINSYLTVWFMNLLIRLAPETVPAIRSKLADPLHQKRTWSYSGRWNGLGKNLSGIYNNCIKIDIRIARRWIINIIGQGNNPSSVTCWIKGTWNQLSNYIYTLKLYLLLPIVLDNIEIRGVGLYTISNDQLPILISCLWNWHMT